MAETGGVALPAPCAREITYAAALDRRRQFRPGTAEYRAADELVATFGRVWPEVVARFEARIACGVRVAADPI